MSHDASRCHSTCSSGLQWKTQRCRTYSRNVQPNTPSANMPRSSARDRRGSRAPCPRSHAVYGPQIKTTCQGRTREKYFSTQSTLNIRGLPRRGRSRVERGTKEKIGGGGFTDKRPTRQG